MRKIAPEGRAEYMKLRRSGFKAFHVEVEKDKMEEFEKKLSEKSQTKKEWLDLKINEELSE